MSAQHTPGTSVAIWETKRGQLYGSRTAMPKHEQAEARAYVSAHVLAETLDALLAVRHEVGFGRIVFETSTSEATLPVIERAFFALGCAGGNTLDSPHRKTWERARAAVDKIEANATGSAS